ncbi:50S ribosomal protein L3 [Candidatus Hecatella orcuttiae]|jgi:large subunit ribosomal protein L3|uniref:50S ribosomal protein L3 n=1 Tax=Candidatus Hecatella orcuttiae TaxID=1935119 RepID=UPI002867CDC8|nr:50S ribosomal protein L3 [Candidatus Hecatella orcuttiae]
MGRRKKHAPRRGSLAFRPRARAETLVPRIRYWPEVPETKLLGFAGYKAGMTYGFVIENEPGSRDYGKEVFCPLTVVETPPLRICALRTYEATVDDLRTLGEVWAEKLPKELGRLVKPPNKPSPKEKLADLEKNLHRACDVRVLACTNPREAGIGKKKPELMEIALGGKSVEEKFQFAKNLLGKTVPVTEVFQEGQLVDAVAVTKGKGFAGPVKRFGIRILQKKSRKTVRGVGTIGPWHPALVMSSVPRAGQLGFARRTELNKKIVKIGVNGSEITPKGGFLRYGRVKGPYILLKGSIPGPPKRLIRLRHAVRAPEKILKPEITYLHV